MRNKGIPDTREMPKEFDSPWAVGKISPVVVGVFKFQTVIG